MTIAVSAEAVAGLRAVALDHGHLWHRLPREMGDGAAFTALRDGRCGLVADYAVVMPSRTADAVAAAVAVLDRTIRRPEVRHEALALAGHPDLAGRVPLSGPLCFDFHLTALGPRLIEINTNPGGLLIAAAVTRAAGLSAEVRAAALAFAGEGRRVAIVDDVPERQFLWPEFLMYRRLFQEDGRQAAIIHGGDLRCGSDGLTAGEGAFDTVYNRLTDFHFTAPDHAALAQAWREDAARFVPDPAAHAAFSDKRLLSLLSRAGMLRALGVPAPDAEAVAALVPATVAVDPLAAEALWQRRRQLFFKPATGHAGKAAYRGDKISRATWDGLPLAHYVAQEVVPPSRLATADGAVFKADMRAFALDGRLVLLAARLYHGQTTNFRTPGGGFAAVRF